MKEVHKCLVNFSVRAWLLILCLMLINGRVSASQLKDGTISIDKFRSDMKQGLMNNLKRFTASGRISDEEKKIIALLIDDKSNPRECETVIIRYLRERYINRDVEFNPRPTNLYSEYNISAKGFPEALFWLKGVSSGLYEYFRLTGMSPLQPFSFYDKIDAVDNREIYEELLKFQLYIISKGLEWQSRYYVFGQTMLFSNRLDQIKELVLKYGNNGVLNDFILNYPFWDGSYIQIRRNQFRDDKYKYNIPPVEDLLWDYYNAVLVTRDNKLLFIEKVLANFDSKEASGILTIIVENNQKQSKPDPIFLENLAKLIVKARLWPVLAKMMETREGQQAATSTYAMIEKQEIELERERAVVLSLKEALGTK